jgi:REP element-mobilizing transposase RayT
MLIQPYTAEELNFAYSYRVYFRTRTHLRKPNINLARLNQETLSELIKPYGIHLLELATNSLDVRALVSLTPAESVAVAASKWKGRVSKWLTDQASNTSAKQIARGYFAVTSGSSTAETISAYLDRQGEHHGYSDRVRPPVFVCNYPATPQSESLLKTDHAVTRLRFHIVLATQRRQGVFGQAAARAVADCWQELQPECRVRIDKVSFVPDHVHLALSVHPSVAPTVVITALMNAAQETMWRQFDREVIQAGVERLWQPSAYVGSFGDLSSNAMSAYVKRWEEDADD